MAPEAPIIGLSLDDACLYRRAVQVTEALLPDCVLRDLRLAADRADEGVRPDLILTDCAKGGAITRLVEVNRSVPVVVLGRDGSQQAAIDAMRSGASDYIWLERCDTEIIAGIAAHLGCKIASRARPPSNEAEPECRWIGTSPDAVRIRDVVGRVAKSNATILIEGETGTGKDVIALALHRQSRRSSGPMVPINCAAIPEALIEGELFGYAKGAFTGAVQAYAGKFREAHGGTLFLDEVGDLSPSAQVKLLRAIESREITPLGSARHYPLDVRIVAATNRDLAKAVEAGAFRSDLYYRLAVVRVALPPLRNRREDIVPIADYLLDLISAENGVARPALDEAFLGCLTRAYWPGNVRELRNALEHAVVTARHPERLTIADLPKSALHVAGEAPPAIYRAEADRDVLLRALADSSGQKAAAARSLNCSRMTLYRRLERAGIDERTIAALSLEVSQPA
jgi:DNA-binding NtrC family response regulator